MAKTQAQKDKAKEKSAAKKAAAQQLKEAQTSQEATGSESRSEGSGLQPEGDVHKQTDIENTGAGSLDNLSQGGEGGSNDPVDQSEIDSLLANKDAAEEVEVQQVIIEPTIGRIVHVYEGAATRTPRAAVVCKVLDNGRINVGCFDWDGSRMPLTNIPLIQAHQELPTGGWWASWMDYQIGQAQKQLNSVERVEGYLDDHEDRLNVLESAVL